MSEEKLTPEQIMTFIMLTVQHRVDTDTQKDLTMERKLQQYFTQLDSVSTDPLSRYKRLLEKFDKRKGLLQITIARTDKTDDIKLAAKQEIQRLQQARGLVEAKMSDQKFLFSIA